MIPHDNAVIEIQHTQKKSALQTPLAENLNEFKKSELCS
jgi:hypothetical protein